MLRKVKPAAWMAAFLICFTGLAGIAWQNNPVNTTRKILQDTFPETNKTKEDKTVINGDLDKALEEINKAQERIEKQLENKDWEKVQRNLEQSLSKIDMDKMQEQLAKAMKQIDLQKIQLQAQQSLKQIDFKKMEADIQKAQEEISKEGSLKMQKHMEEAMEATRKAMENIKSVDMEKIQRNLERSKEELKLNEGKMREEMERARKDIQLNLHKDFRKEFEKAKEGINRAAAELQNYKEMLTEMDKDGLIKMKEAYNVKYKNGVLTINGKIQPDNITNKYKHYFKKENVTLKKVEDGVDEDERTIDL